MVTWVPRMSEIWERHFRMHLPPSLFANTEEVLARIAGCSAPGKKICRRGGTPWGAWGGLGGPHLRGLELSTGFEEKLHQLSLSWCSLLGSPPDPENEFGIASARSRCFWRCNMALFPLIQQLHWDCCCLGRRIETPGCKDPRNPWTAWGCRSSYDSAGGGQGGIEARNWYLDCGLLVKRCLRVACKSIGFAAWLCLRWYSPRLVLSANYSAHRNFEFDTH